MIRGLVVGAVIGVFLGTIGLVIACLACLVIAFQGGGHAVIPGVFDAWLATEDGLPQLRFLPDLGGMGLVLLAVAVLGAAVGVQLRRRRSVARPADDAESAGE